MTTAYPISGRKIPKTLYFAQGWVHAQDRAWQLEFQRRVGHGKLSEILGDSVIETDRYLRTLGFSDVAQQEYEKMPEPYKGWLESYSEGVSAYLASRPPGRLGLEFAILRLKGTKWGRRTLDSRRFPGLGQDGCDVALQERDGRCSEIISPAFRGYVNEGLLVRSLQG
jgi:hypothetical protein